MFSKIKKKYLVIFLILMLLFIIYRLLSILKNKDIEIKLLDVITNNLQDDLKETFITNESDKKYADKVFTECPECEECENNEWKGPPCPECDNDCPTFKQDKIIYKDLVTDYKIEFPNYQNLNKREKDLLSEIFSMENIPEPSRDREYFPYSVINNKIDMDSVIPTMA